MTPQTPRPTAPTIAALTARFLQRSAEAAATTEVEPHEVSGGFRAAPADLWREAHAAAGIAPTPVPAEWPAYTAADAAAGPVPFAAGLFPQRVRTLAAATAPTAMPVPPVSGFTGLKSWVAKETKVGDFGRRLVAAGVAAGVGDHAAADAALKAAEAVATPAQQPLWRNQAGACAWLAGRPAEAVMHWDQAGELLAARFNRGLAALAAGDTSAAGSHFAAAAAGLPESSGWCHLARLYRVLAA